MNTNYNNDFEARYATYLALGGEPKEFANIFEVDLAILEIIQQGIGGDFKTNHYMDADGRLIVERGEDGRTVISDEHENPIIERLADGTTKIFDAYQGERMTISANGNITFQELTSLSAQVANNTSAIHAISVSGGASTAEAVNFIDGESLATKAAKWTKKVRVDIVPSGTSYKFMLGEQELNFADLNRMLQETPDFIVFVYDNREHRCVRIELDGSTKFMEFTSPIIEGVNTKAQSFLVTSVNGTQIFTVKRTDIINENLSNKSNTLDVLPSEEEAKYPTIKAVKDKIEKSVTSENGEGNADANITDENGNILLSLINGAIKTTRFDSRKIGFDYNINLDGIFLVRDNCVVQNGVFVTQSGKYCSNKIGCKNANYLNVSNNNFDKIVLFDSLGGYEETTNSFIDLDGKYNSFIIQSEYNNCTISINYSNETDVDMVNYPLYFRIPVNLTRFNNSTDSILYDYPLAVCHFAKSFTSKKAVLLNGGFGKVITIDGWKSTNSTNEWNSFILSLQNADLNVISVEGGRKITTSDIYREGAGYVMPSLGNPLILQAFIKAHEMCRKTFNMSERVGFIGASQGGILAFNYNYLTNGAISAVVVLAGLSRLYEDGWTRQDSRVQSYFNEWYGITDYDENVVKGFDPYKHIIDGKMMNFPPLRCVYGTSDTTAEMAPAQNIVNAVKAGNGVAEMREIVGGTHTTVAGATDPNVVNLTITWLNRFL